MGDVAVGRTRSHTVGPRGCTPNRSRSEDISQKEMLIKTGVKIEEEGLYVKLDVLQIMSR
jgi:hypothetical protein